MVQCHVAQLHPENFFKGNDLGIYPTIDSIVAYQNDDHFTLTI